MINKAVFIKIQDSCSSCIAASLMVPRSRPHSYSRNVKQYLRRWRPESCKDDSDFFFQGSKLKRYMIYELWYIHISICVFELRAFGYLAFGILKAGMSLRWLSGAVGLLGCCRMVWQHSEHSRLLSSRTARGPKHLLAPPVWGDMLPWCSMHFWIGDRIGCSWADELFFLRRGCCCCCCCCLKNHTIFQVFSLFPTKLDIPISCSQLSEM